MRTIFCVTIGFVILFCSCNSDNTNLFNAAQKNYQNGNYSSSIEMLNKISQDRELNFDEYALRGESYYCLRKYYFAIGDFRNSIKSKLADTGILKKLARSYLAVKNYDSSMIYYNALLKFNKNDFEAINERGLCLLGKSQPKIAALDFERSMQINPNYYMTYSNIALMNQNAGNYRLALKYYNLSISKNQLDDKVFYNRGINYFYLKRPDSALIDFNKAIQLYPDESDYYLNRGIAFYLLNNRKNACNDWQIAVKMNNGEAAKYLSKYCNP